MGSAMTRHFLPSFAAKAWTHRVMRAFGIGRYFGIWEKNVYPLHGAYLFPSVIVTGLKNY